MKMEIANVTQDIGKIHMENVDTLIALQVLNGTLSVKIVSIAVELSKSTSMEDVSVSGDF